MWCKICNIETRDKKCSTCGSVTEADIPVEVFWCDDCKTPIIREVNAIDKKTCSLCGRDTKYLTTDIRPVFPEERLLIELLNDKPLKYINKSIWASANRYYVDGKVFSVPSTKFAKADIDKLSKQLVEYKDENNYDRFNKQIHVFIEANKSRINYLEYEAFSFIQSSSNRYKRENIVISFSGGKDSTVVADLVVRALSDPSVVHIYGDTTLEFPMTTEYAVRFREDNSKAIFKVAKNKEQNFYEMCEDIGPPARMLRWCCTMFKTGPITRVINKMYRGENILTFYGIRKCESVSRSKYNRIEDNAEAIKIQKQTVASPIFFWKDVDIWLYLLSKNIDFNDSYRLGYDRVGCWCCPNNNERAQFLSKIYMPERATKWRDFLISFAEKIGKPDAEVYIDSGKWKARQGGNGLKASEDVKIKFANCTAEENAKVYLINKPYGDDFIELFTPFGKISKELGRKLINETLILDIRTNVPIMSLQPFTQDGYEYSVKIKTMNVEKHDNLQRMAGYQVRKFNACRQCLKCESLCKFGAITIKNGEYHIDDKKCTRCKMCVTAKYLSDGCFMKKFLATKEENR